MEGRWKGEGRGGTRRWEKGRGRGEKGEGEQEGGKVEKMERDWKKRE